jgi:hypothetical protein
MNPPLNVKSSNHALGNADLDFPEPVPPAESAQDLCLVAGAAGADGPLCPFAIEHPDLLGRLHAREGGRMPA